jgi:hypothetical protein
MALRQGSRRFRTDAALVLGWIGPYISLDWKCSFPPRRPRRRLISG